MEPLRVGEVKWDYEEQPSQVKDILAGAVGLLGPGALLRGPKVAVNLAKQMSKQKRMADALRAAWEPSENIFMTGMK